MSCSKVFQIFLLILRNLFFVLGTYHLFNVYNIYRESKYFMVKININNIARNVSQGMFTWNTAHYENIP